MIDTHFLREIAAILQKSLNAYGTYQAVFDLLETTLPFESATLFLYDKAKDRMEKTFHKGAFTVDLIGEIAFERGPGISSWISHRKEPLVLESLTKSRPGREAKFNSFLSLPLWASGSLIGVLNLGHSQANFFKREESESYRYIAIQISEVIHTLLLQQQLDQKNKALLQTIEQLKAAQKELVEKERLAAIGEIVVTVNHEINNPLTSIIGLAEIMKLSCSTMSTEKTREALQGILKEAYRIQRVTHQLRELDSSESQVYCGDQRMIKLKA
jgi:signal transduction histidine kinase